MQKALLKKKITVLEVGRSSWTFWMCSIQSYEPLKAEKFLWLLSERCNRREGQQIGEAEKFKMWEELEPLWRWKESGHKPRNELTSSVTESKLVLLATKRANHSRNKVLGQGIASLFREPADWEDGRPAFSKNSLARDWIQPSFILKGEGLKSCFWLDSGRDALIYSFPQPFTGGPGRDAPVS